MSSKYISFDTETTGLDSDKCNLLTVCFIILDSDLNEIDRLNISLKQVNYYVNVEALKVNKINLVKHHDNSIDIIDARNKLHNFLDKYKTQYNLIPIGHNIKFDISFIKSSGLLMDNEYLKYISFNAIDTISIAQFLKLSGKLPKQQSISLVNLCKYAKLDQEQNQEHTAEYDTEMTIKLLRYFKEIGTEIQEESEPKTKKRKFN